MNLLLVLPILLPLLTAALLLPAWRKVVMKVQAGFPDGLDRRMLRQLFQLLRRFRPRGIVGMQTGTGPDIWILFCQGDGPSAGGQSLAGTHRYQPRHTGGTGSFDYGRAIGIKSGGIQMGMCIKKRYCHRCRRG